MGLFTGRKNAMTRLPISVCLIAGNEAHRIRRALDSVAGWAGEIVIVLNEDVADGTDKIAAEYGAKIFREPWKGFVGQKNSATAKATLEWVLNLDADEEISAGLGDELAGMFNGAASPAACHGYEIPRCTLYCGRWIRHGDWYPDRTLRLWRRGHGTWGGVEPHAAIQLDGRAGRLHHDLLHYSMENLNHHLRKSAGYSDIFARQHSGRKVGVAEIWFRPWWRFVRGYIIRRGFLDGWQGYAVARLSSQEVFLRYVKIREARQPAAGPPAPQGITR